MAVRFVVGRAGSGKTFRCLEAVRSRLREDAFGGSKLLLLVPEQASFQMERAMIETPDIAGFARCEVLSFQRLAYRLFAETGSDPRRGDQTIGPLGRLMAIRRLIRQHRSHLRLFDRVADKPGLVRQVAGALDELMREDVDPQQLAKLAEQREADDPLGAARLADLTRLYQAYLDYLIDDRIDPAQYLGLAAERLTMCRIFDGAEVWVDGFAGFTQQEYNLLTELARRAASMEITLLIDATASAIDAVELPAPSYSLFSRTERTVVRLRRAFGAASIPMENPVRLSRVETSRFQPIELAQIEAHLFRSPPKTKIASPRPEVIRVVEAPDRRSEVQAAIAEIQRLMREADPPMRYRDVAIIVRDLALYHDLIAGAMRAHGIPCFIDHRQPTTHHPLVELVRALLAIAADDCCLDSVRLTLKTQLLPLSDEESDLLENYLLAHDLSGLAHWRQPWHYTRLFHRGHDQDTLSESQQQILDRVNDCRQRWLTAVEPWLTGLDTKTEQPGRFWAERLFACLDHLNTDARLHEWAQAAEADGRTSEADEHRQVWSDFVELLDEFVHALGNEPMRIDEFRETIEAALGEFSLGLAPATLDEVLVGAIERSRHPTIRAALILGFDEHLFPVKRQEDPLLGDRDREALEAAGVEVGSSRRRQLLEERLLAYIAVTRASERLWISYARTDAEGKPVNPSPYLQDLQAAWPGLAVDRLADPGVERSTRDITSVSELSARLAAEFRYRSALTDETSLPPRRRWNALYEAGRARTEWHGTLSRGLAGLAYRNDARLEVDLLNRAVRKPFSASVSRLEKFAACPFAHFANYFLDLNPRVEADLQQVDLGTLCHAILEKFIDDLARQNQRLAELGDDEIAARIDATAKAILPAISDDMLLDHARNAYLFDRSRGHMQRITRWQRTAARVSRFRPCAVEWPFGFSGSKAAPLTLKTPKGRTVYLRGYIDRVDVAELGDALLGAVIDYKRTTQRRLNFSQVYHGLSLQLVGYLLALQQSGESLTGRPIRPVAAFYLPLLEPYKSVPHPEVEKASSFQCRGIAETAALPVLDETVQPGGKSEFFSAALKKDGQPHSRSDLATPEQLSALMQHVGRRMGELADELLDGNVSVSPYRLNRQIPCSFCEYQSVCRYEIQTQPPRALESLSKTEVLKRLEGAVDDD